MVLDLLAHPFLSIPLGALVSVLIAVLLSRRWILRGYLLWGIVAGVLALLAAFWSYQYLLGLGYAQGFAETGPCRLCDENAGFIFVFSWFGWAVGALVFAAINLNAIIHRPKDRPQLTKHLPGRAIRWMLGAAVAGALGFAGNQLIERARTAVLLDRIHSAQGAISGPTLRELGSVRLTSMSLSPYPDIRYPAALAFGAEGRWLVVTYEDGLELWRMEDLSRRTLVEAEDGYWGGKAAVTPDGSTLIVVGGELAGYAAYDLRSDGIRTLWQGDEWNWPIAMAFGGNGRELVILDPDYQILRLEVSSGKLLTQRPMINAVRSLQGEKEQTLLSPSGDYLAVRADARLRIFETRNGNLIFEKDLAALPGQEEWTPYGAAAFLPDGRLVWTGPYISPPITVWVPEDLNLMRTELAIGTLSLHEVGGAMSPNGNFAVHAGDQVVVFRDLARGVALGTVPVGAAVTATAFSPDGRLLAVGAADSTLRFYAVAEP